MQILVPYAVYVEDSFAEVKFLGPKLCAFQVLIAVPLFLQNGDMNLYSYH